MPHPLLLFFAHLVYGAPSVEVLDTHATIVVDGILDEAIWSEATPIVDFLRYEPTAGAAPPGSTEVRILQDANYLYIGASIKDAPGPIQAHISKREDINVDDQIGVYLDTFKDGQSGYIFYVNPRGIQQDIRCVQLEFRQGRRAWNFGWDTVFKSEGRILDRGYDIEMAIPWRSLKYPAGTDPQEWGIILTRKIPGTGEKYSFPVRERRHPRMFSQAATLSGIKPGDRGTGLELVPGITVGQNWPRQTDPPDWEGLDTWHEVIRPSLDLRYSITPQLGITATGNPDFSHIESDVEDIRLNERFAYQYREKRPFFLDGGEYFEDLSATLYSRSINEPLYGIKLAGREGQWSMGMLHAMDRTPLASFTEGGTNGFNEPDVEGRWASNSIVRVRTDLPGAGYVGITAADKRIIGSLDTSGNRGGWDGIGADFSVPLGKQVFVGGSTLQSFTSSDGFAPLWGQENRLFVRRMSSTGFSGELYGTDRTTDFRNEMSYLPQAGTTMAGALARYTVEGTGMLNRWSPGLGIHTIHERNGDFLRSFYTEQRVALAGVHHVELVGAIDQIRESDTELLGWGVTAEYDGRIGSIFSMEPSVGVGQTIDYDLLSPAITIQTALEFTLRPIPALRLDTIAQYQHHTPEDAPSSEAYLIRTSLFGQFTREIGLRLIAEYSDGTDNDTTLDTSLLFTWLQHPGTAAYIGYSESLIFGDEVTSTGRGVFAKVTFQFRP